MQPDYIDIHKHESVNGIENNVRTVFNRYGMFSSLSREKQYSIGIHPWYTDNLETQWNDLRVTAADENVIAIGECGMDAIRGTSLELQAAIFQKQILLANECNKPLIIHCVRAFPQVLSLLKQANVPVIFHGFNKKLSIATEVLQQGYYLSFGADLLKDNTAASAVFANIPANRFFLETDDSPISIKEIYQTAARIRKTAEDAIILQVKENFKTVFNL